MIRKPNHRNNSCPPGKGALAPQVQFRRLCLYALLAYVALGLVIVSPIYALIVLRPEGPGAALYSIEKILNSPREEYFFAGTSGKELHGWLFRTPGSDRVVIVHHGNAGNILHRLFIAKHCIQIGASVFIYDYRGYGKSEGSAAISHLQEDGLDAYDFVRNKLKFDRIINYGESIGSAVAAKVASERPSEGLIMQSAICSLPAVAKDGVVFMKMYPDWMYPSPHLDNRSTVQKVKAPILFVHGARDTMVPCRHSEQLFAVAHAPKVLVKLPDCGHNNVGDNDEQLYIQALKNFIDSTSVNRAVSLR